MERVAVKIENIEDMILMSDKVVDEVMMGSISKYDTDGNPLPIEQVEKQYEQDRNDGTAYLVRNIVHGKYEDFEQVLKRSAEELGNKLASVKKRILGIFRGGILEEWFWFSYYADESVPDDWLFTLFLMRVRDRTIVLASHKLGEELDDMEDTDDEGDEE